MRINRIHFHHFPGHEHGHGHCHEHESAGPQRTKEQTIQLLEYLSQHNAEHAEELDGYREEMDDAQVAGLLAESVYFLKRSTAKLDDAIAMYKRGA